MKRLLQVVVALFAVIGVAYTAFAVYANWFLPRCILASSQEAQSPDGKYFAVFEQSNCQDPGRSRATVEMGTLNSKKRIVWLDVKGTTDVRMTWNDNRELIVTLPESAVVKRYGPYDEWPQVIERRLPNQ
jgi:predicted membrane metal-binding protein